MAGKSIRQKLIERLDAVFSMYVRLRDCNEHGIFRCISCYRDFPFDEADCGHYIPRQHMSLRFDERNCNAQCRGCNQYAAGNLENYRLGLVAKYGESVVLSLESKKHEVNKLSEYELRDMISHYRKEVKRLKKEKRLS